MSKISLQFVLGSGISSRLIAWWGSGYLGYSHVDAILSDGSLIGARSDKCGGQPPGVHIRPPEYEPWKRKLIVDLDTTVQEALDWDAFLRSQIGLGYDKGDILGLILGIPLMQAGHWICSAYQTRGLRKIGKFPLDTPQIDQQLTPNTLLFGTLVAGGKIRK